MKNKNSIGISVFGYENKEKYPIYVSKKFFEVKHVDLLLTGAQGKRDNVLIKYFSKFMYNHTLHPTKKHFCPYCLQAFSTEKTLKRHIKDCFKINDKEKIIMPKKANMLKSKIMR